jgi:hypothetical protein
VAREDYQEAQEVEGNTEDQYRTNKDESGDVRLNLYY